MKDEGGDVEKLILEGLRGFGDGQANEWTNRWTDICDCRVAFATENVQPIK